ncbi:hypothetical protein L5515_009533 [Caenorhabditis briggsae]|uniref:Uncharacterized protein n=1 Tax=Caenorhabditis briggsae TaxID=6238 RepID=A0AAE9F8F5_CAEBR|nr:hypothetical protein L5515_009533 [Caenorhabditis briggsae]
MVFLTIALKFEITTKADKTVDSKHMSLYWAFCDSKIVDTFFIPTITQITYLGCNRRNVMTLWKSLKPKWLFRSSRRIDSDVRVQYG